MRSHAVQPATARTCPRSRFVHHAMRTHSSRWAPTPMQGAAAGRTLLALRTFAAYATLWTLWCTAYVLQRCVSSAPDSVLTQHNTPAWWAQCALAGGPLLASLALAVHRCPARELAALPPRYWALLVPAALAGAAVQWLTHNSMSQFFGMAGGLLQAARPLVVSQLGVALAVGAAPVRGETAALVALAVVALAPLAPLMRVASVAVMAPQLLCAAAAPLLLQRLLQQEAAPLLPVLLHLRIWQLLAVLAQLLLLPPHAQGRVSAAAAQLPGTLLSYPWLAMYSVVVVAHESLWLALLHDAGALTSQLYATLACLPYPTIWSIIMSHTRGERVGFYIAALGAPACLAAAGLQHWRASEGGSAGGRAPRGDNFVLAPSRQARAFHRLVSSPRAPQI